MIFLPHLCGQKIINMMRDIKVLVNINLYIEVCSISEDVYRNGVLEMFLGAHITSESVSGITFEIQCIKIENEHDLALDLFLLPKCFK